MKVKNIMFAGFAAAILSGVCGAASAADYTLVTQGYVTDKLSEKADKTYVGTVEAVNNQMPASVVEYVNLKTAGIATDAALEDLTNTVNTLKGTVNHETTGLATKASQTDLNALSEKVGEKSVATQIAEAVGDEVVRADAAYQPKGDYQAAGNYALKSELPTVPTKVGAFENDAGYLTSTTAGALYDAKGAAAAVDAKLSDYATTEALEAVKTTAEANVAMEKVTGLADALDAKAAANDVSALSQTVAGLETSKADATAVNTLSQTVEGLKTSKADATAVNTLSQDVEGLKTSKADASTVYTKTETDDLLDAKQDTLTFDTTPTEGSTNPVTSGGVQAALATKADASDIPTDYVTTQTFTEYQGTVTNELSGKQDTITNLATIEAGATAGASAVQPGADVSVLNNNAKYQTEAQVANTIAAGNYLTSTGLAQGTYLVTSDGKNGITYKSVVVIDANGNEM